MRATGDAGPTGRVDVVVVGAGVVGAAAAGQLADRGARVVLLDADPRGGAGSRAAAGVAVPSLRLAGDPPLHTLAKAGLTHLHTWLDGSAELAGELRRHVAILRPVSDERERAELERSSADDPAALGTWVDSDDLGEREPLLRRGAFAGAFLATRGAMVDADAYVDALLDSAAQSGVTLSLGVAAQEVTDTAVGVSVRTTSGVLEAGVAIVAAGPHSGAIAGLERLPVGPQRGQMLLLRRPGSTLRHIVSSRLYVAPWSGGGICVGATEERAGFSAHCTPGGLAVLSSFAIKLAPSLADAQLQRAWAGLRSVTSTGRPLIGPYPGTRHVLVATGLGGQGILTGALVGAAAAELVDAGKSELAEPFFPAAGRR